MKNTEMLFLLLNNLDIYRYLSLHIMMEIMDIQLKYFVFFPCTWMIKLLNTSKINQSFFGNFK